ncbi:glycerol-3-phosphate dehydrogenase subunit GlpB [Aestuariimicrobium sp. T2.26MG-19.2B]|uniref:glycerol-3-phosphate dehydrogenase subunit GlpB n=1 Tax=Aestuariimicrobium sp. T2.26MG-19.2B TaxID=3040679 RepID=UPI002477B3EB|nr:glycerol-3-phosphate dehydrogenase subunit GlpB [Aestuariimicrobium sp. T2.26MG-19.2B]CAI9404131.1 Anaerobic glycerol-3-phosphate dehydrogenase subunit B [Aestuariimicrobium sp. T2.26MG-19.2B]
MSTPPTGSRVVVVGAGFAGLYAATALDRAGHRVTLVTQGLGGMQLSQGTLDVLGYRATDERGSERVTDSLAAIDELPEEHPYRTIGADAVERGVAEFLELAADAPGAVVMRGDVRRPTLLPTAVGAWRPTAFVPVSMLAGAPEPGKHLHIVGIRQLKDFHPQLIATNLGRTPLDGVGPVESSWSSLDFLARAGEIDSSPVVYARALDEPATLSRFADRLATHVREQALPEGAVLGLPAVLGLERHPEVLSTLERASGVRIFEIVMQPPSVPGMRLNQALTRAYKAGHGRLLLGSSVVGVKSEQSAGGDQRVTAVTVHVAGGDRDIACDHVVFAPGGFESGALELDSHDQLHETALGLPLHGVLPIEELVHGDYWGAPQKLFAVGLRTDGLQRPVDETGAVVYSNLHAAGSILAGAYRWQEKSGEGIALGSARRCIDAIVETSREQTDAPAGVQGVAPREQKGA